MELNEAYWTERYTKGQTGWDIGYVSTPLKSYIDQLTNKGLSILIPGAGNSYEAEYLWENGFTNITVVDLSEEPLINLKKRIPDFNPKRLIHGDFFELENRYDLVLEQTFFCALSPDLRPAYVIKMKQILKEKGKLVGVLFNIPLFDDHPPFGGNEQLYRPLFEPYFKINIMEVARNSIPQRQGNELFVSMSPKS